MSVSLGEVNFPVSMQKFDITNDAIADLSRSLTDRETRVLLIPTYVTHPDGENAGHLSLLICHEGRLICADFYDKTFELSIEDIRSRMREDAYNPGTVPPINDKEGLKNDLYINFGFP